MAACQTTCPEVLQLAKSPSLKCELVDQDGVQVLCDVSRGRRRPLVPAAWQRAVFSSIHELAHPGIRATRRLLSRSFVWRGMASTCRTWCLSCLPCQRGKVTRQPAAPVQPIPIPLRKFSHIHVDLVGPLSPTSTGTRHVLTIVDRTTRWAEVIPMASTTATACADAITSGWIARFGVPETITTDRGAQFTSDVWSVLCTRFHIQHNRTTAYHPQSNGMLERFHRQLKDALRARLAGTDWLSSLPYVLLGLRAAPKEDSGVSSAELVYGCPLTLPGELISTPEVSPHEVLDHVRRAAPPAVPTRPLTYAEVACKPLQQLMSSSFVFIRKGEFNVPALSPLYTGPFKVLSKGPKSFVLDLGGRHESVSVDRLKPYLGGDDVQPARAPPMGRPPLRGGLQGQL